MDDTEPKCSCPIAGFCERYKIQQEQYIWEICQGIHGENLSIRYRKRWRRDVERGGSQQVQTAHVPIQSSPQSPPAPVQVVTKQQKPGLGDKVESALTSVGVTKDRVEKWLGRPCNCTERKRKLNNLGNWLNSFFSSGNTDIQSEMKNEAAEALEKIIQDPPK